MCLYLDQMSPGISTRDDTDPEDGQIQDHVPIVTIQPIFNTTEFGYKASSRLLSSLDDIYYSTPTTPDDPQQNTLSKSIEASEDCPGSLTKRQPINHENIQLLQHELDTLRVKYEASLENTTQMKNVLDEYENTMKSMIEETQKMREEHRISIENATKEKNLIEIELGSVELVLKDTKQRHDDMKIICEGFRKASTVYVFIN